MTQLIGGFLLGGVIASLSTHSWLIAGLQGGVGCIGAALISWKINVNVTRGF